MHGAVLQDKQASSAKAEARVEQDGDFEDGDIAGRSSCPEKPEARASNSKATLQDADAIVWQQAASTSTTEMLDEKACSIRCSCPVSLF